MLTRSNKQIYLAFLRWSTAGLILHPPKLETFDRNELSGFLASKPFLLLRRLGLTAVHSWGEIGVAQEGVWL